jgi:predicted Zn-dependent protease with MMP-like domain
VSEDDTEELELEATEALWTAYFDALDSGPEYLDEASAALDRLAAELGEEAPAVLYERAVIAWEREGPEAAIRGLDRLLRLEPDYADAHYARAMACEEAGDREGMILHFLETLRVDEAMADDFAVSPEQLELVVEIAERVLANLPAELRPHLDAVAIVLEDRPSEQDVGAGFDPRALGLFEGLEQSAAAAKEPSAVPTRIVLFTANLLADFPEPEELADQIEITLLHEIGHYFGLDEDEVERLGLW